jgi:hypothetical protein
VGGALTLDEADQEVLTLNLHHPASAKAVVMLYGMQQLRLTFLLVKKSMSHAA